MNAALTELRFRYPWPEMIHDQVVGTPANIRHAWFDPASLGQLMLPYLKDKKVILELGAWLGASTGFILNNSNAHVITVDHWCGSDNHHDNKNLLPYIPHLYEDFLYYLKDYKDRVTPVRATITGGLAQVKDCGIIPDLIYLDGSHEYVDVSRDISNIFDSFPDVTLIGDDFHFPGVQDAVLHFMSGSSIVGMSWQKKQFSYTKGFWAIV